MKLSLHRCTAGTVAVATALILPLLLGFGSLGIEVGHWYLMQRQMQGAADAAAISAAAQYIQDRVAGKTTSTAYQTTGQSYASLNGFTIPLANTCLITASGVADVEFARELFDQLGVFSERDRRIWAEMFRSARLPTDAS